MKAIVRHKYGFPDLLELQEIETPPLPDDQVMIRVHAASVNPLDWHFLRGTPFVIRMTGGPVRPKRKILGADVAGTVEAVGATVTRIQPGDDVFAASPTLGTFAEYLCFPPESRRAEASQRHVRRGAAVPVAALTALQGLRDKGHIERGHKVLNNGAAGGVGAFAVQIAKSFGAEVTGVCSTRNLEMVGSLGADRVIDYFREDFTKDGAHYDLILDVYGNHSLSEYKRILNPEGMFVSAAGSLLRTLRIALPGSKRIIWFIADPNLEDMTFLKELLETGKVTPVIDRSYRLNEAPDAIRYLEEGHAQGKVIITV